MRLWEWEHLSQKKKKKVKGMETATTFESNNRKIKLILQYQIEKKKIFSQKKKITHALLVIIETERTMPPQKVEK